MQAMLPVISGRLRRLSTWPVAGLAFVAVVLCQAGFYWRQARLGGLEVLDTRQWYTPEQVVALFDALDRHDAGARAVYAWTEVSPLRTSPSPRWPRATTARRRRCRGWRRSSRC